jgi:hypothetical protein
MGIYLAGVMAIHGLVFWNARDLVWKGYPDFTIYYTAGTMVRSGMGGQLYNDQAQFRVQQQFAPQVATRLAALPFNHPPFEALLFVPFSFLSYPIAYSLWMLVNLAMLAALPWVLRNHVPLLRQAPAWVWFAASLGFFPIFFALLQGQDAILLLFLYALAFVALKQGRLVAAGAWLACGLFKFHLVLPFLVLLLLKEKSFEGKKKIVLGFAFVGGLLALVSLAVVGMRQMIFYPRYVLGLEATAEGAIRPLDMPNLRGMLYLIGSKLPHFDTLAVLLSGLLFLFAIWIMRLPDDAQDKKISLALLVTVLVSYHGLGYDLCVLVLPMLLLAGCLQSNTVTVRWARTAMIAGLAGLLFSPIQVLLSLRYNRLGWLGWAVLFLTIGVMGEAGARRQRVTDGAPRQ